MLSWTPAAGWFHLVPQSHPFWCWRQEACSLRNASRLDWNEDIPPIILLKQNLPTAGPGVIPRRDSADCSWSWIVFYIGINCQCLKIIRIHCFSWKSWQLGTRIPTWRPSAGVALGLRIPPGACAIQCPMVPPLPCVCSSVTLNVTVPTAPCTWATSPGLMHI